MEPFLSSIYEHPVKSARGLAVTAAEVRPEGLARDRRFVVVGPDGTFVSGRSHPRLVLIEPSWDGQTLVLRAPALADLTLRPTEDTAASVAVWKDRFPAWDQGPGAAAWLSEFLGDPLRLVWLGESQRPLRWDRDQRVTFADAAPFLLIGEASRLDLEARVGEPLSMRRFRPNFVAEGCEAFAEDQWRRLRIGDVEFLNLDGCGRCEFTTIDPESGLRHPAEEPKATLEAYRQTDTGIYFGTNLMALSGGTVRVGDRIEVLETRRPLQFGGVPWVVRAPEDDRWPEGAAALVCTEVRPEAEGLKTLVLQRKDGLPFTWAPGQYLTLEVPAGEAGEALTRSYSITSLPGDEGPGALAVTVKRLADGRASRWLHESFGVGGEVRGLGIGGRFTLEDHPWQSYLLVGAGSGVTALLALVKGAAAADLPIDLAVHLSFRTGAEAPFRGAWDDLQTRLGSRLTLRIRLTTAEGRIDHQDLVKFCPDLRDRKAFVCGPPEFRGRVRSLLAGAGFKVDRRYVEEVFGDHALELPEAPEPGRVTFLPSGKTVPSDGLTTVLQLAERAGLAVASSCRAGDCGTCRVVAGAGQVILACETFPRGDLTVTL